MARLYQTEAQTLEPTGRLFEAQKTREETTGRLYAPTEKKPDVTTLEGLKEVGEKAGLKEPIEKITEAVGEKPKEIWSGGWISDIFDALNIFQYGVVGLIKGKGFSEGVKTRQSFTDKDALGDFGLPGVIGGIALDIAVDPLTYIAPVTILKKIPKVTKVAKFVSKSVKASRAGQLLGRSFIYRFGQDPIYAEMAERTTKNIAVGNQNLLDIARPLTKLDPATQRIVATARKAGKLMDLPKEVLDKAKPAFDELDRLGKEAVEVGLLKKETYDSNVCKYISRLYERFEVPVEGVIKKVKGLFPRKPLRIDLSRFKKRTDIPKDIREAMGEILEAGYPTAKGLVQLNKAVEQGKFFKEVASKWGKETIESGFKKLPNVKSLGELANKAVPFPIFDDIQEIIRPRGGLIKKIVGSWKFAKVVMNPATHARNIMSNFILNDFEGLSPHRLDIYGEAAKEMVKKGKWYKEAKKVGLGLDTFASREIKDILIGPDGKGFIKKFGNEVVEKLSNIYQKEEEFAKLAQYIFQRKKELVAEEAWEVAERATFNYAQVTPFIRRLRESIFGYPFITFSYKVTPQVAKTLARKPTKISNIGKIKTGIENMSGIKELTRERASEPDWVRDGFYVKLPIKDKHGRSSYLDLTYIMPFGDLISGQLIQRGIKRETGLTEGIPESLIRKLAFPSLVKELVTNQDFFGNKIFLESDKTDKQLGDIMRHLMKFGLPPTLADQIPGGYRPSGERRKGTIQRVIEKERGIEAGGKQTRTFQQELLRNIGLKIQPLDIKLQEYWSRYGKEKAIKTLLEERGIIKEFKRPFIPK